MQTVALLLGLVLPLAGCSRRQQTDIGSDGTPPRLLMYCTPTVRALAAELSTELEKGAQFSVTVAPLRGGDILSALDALGKGDLVLCPEGPLLQHLEQKELAAKSVFLGEVSVCIVSRSPFSIQALADPEQRIGGGTSTGPLGRTTRRALPPDAVDAIEENIRVHSNRSAELLRYLDGDVLDAVLVWEVPELRKKYQVLSLSTAENGCRVFLVRLVCSRLSRQVMDRVFGSMQKTVMRGILQKHGVFSPAGGGKVHE